MGKLTTIWDRIMKTYEDPDRIEYGFRNEAWGWLSGMNRWLGKI